MAELPKIAQARLRAQNAANPAAGGQTPSAGLTSGEHLDANLLAAFAESALTGPEREQVLHHLSRCANCREVASLAVPQQVEAFAAVAACAVEPKRRRNPWPVLRWGALAGVLATLTVVVVLHPGMWKRPHQVSQATAPASRGENVANNVQAAPPPPAPLRSDASAPTKAKPPAAAAAAAQGFSREKSVVGKAAESGRDKSASRQDMALQEREVEASDRQQHGMIAMSRANGFEAKGGGTLGAEQARRGISAPSAKDSAASPTPAAPAAQPMAASGEAGKESNHSGAAPAKSPSTTESVGGTAQAPPAAATANTRLNSSAGLGGFSAGLKKMEVNSLQPAILWNVSTNGKVRRSTDGGKSFKHIRVAHGVRFWAIASIGNNVWAAGTAGTLFHSVDSGATWTGTPLIWAGSAVKETIVGIQMRDLDHLTLTTDSGSRWSSEDGGRSWQKQP